LQIAFQDESNTTKPPVARVPCHLVNAFRASMRVENVMGDIPIPPAIAHWQWWNTPGDPLNPRFHPSYVIFIQPVAEAQDMSWSLSRKSVM
jgi:hypothetical protein